MPIPLLLIGDAPTQPSGLARVSRDLGRLIYDNCTDAVDLFQIGLQAPQGSGPWSGPWPLFTFSGYERMGAATLDRVLGQFRSKGIVFALWDAHFSFDLLQIAKKHGWQFWIYPPVDSVNQDGVFGGPAAQVIREADQVLAYGQWAAGVLGKIRQREVVGIPLGISSIWQPVEPPPPVGIPEWDNTDYSKTEYLAQPRPAPPKVIGCVATNQPRKDLNLYFATIAELRRRGHRCDAWLLTDAVIKKQGSSWSIPELRLIHGLDEGIRVFTHADQIGDLDLVRLYQASSVTIAPGCGEGFGYPIVESLACGVPVIHGDYAGGAELLGVGHLEHNRITPLLYRVDGVYALRRPIYDEDHFANAVEWIWNTPKADPARRRDCRDAADKYRWPAVWPQWEAWIRQGIADYTMAAPSPAPLEIVP